jgi:hypothetical protein
MGKCLWVALLLGLSACGGGVKATDPEQARQDAIRTAKDCADPEWKAAHLGVWYSACRPNAALR